jgi:pseudouridine synthase
LILAGRVEVNRKPVDTPARSIDPRADEVYVDGQPINMPEEFTYLVLNKPSGFIVTRTDPGGRPTIFDILRDVEARVFPVGRLDKDTTGLIILTNDGELTHRLAHPSYEIEKVYHVETDLALQQNECEMIENGLLLDGRRTSPASLRKIGGTDRGHLYELTIVEGRKRQVRRMFQSLGKQVLSLKRVRLDGIELGDLPEGKWRRLTPDEIEALKMEASMGG